MKIVETPLNGMNWGEQTIYLDDRGRLVGCQDSQQCCESFGHGIWSADPDFNEETAFFADPFITFSAPDEAVESMWPDEDSDPAVVSFILKDDSGRTGYLIVGNDHNGYYSHEYFAKENDTVAISDCL